MGLSNKRVERETNMATDITLSEPTVKQRELILLEKTFNVFVHPDNCDVDITKLHNTRIWIDGIPLILVVEGMLEDDETEELANR